jgi:hypothetical protein
VSDRCTDLLRLRRMSVIWLPRRRRTVKEGDGIGEEMGGLYGEKVMVTDIC